MIVPGSSSQSLAAALSSELDRPLARVEFERFPDGELLASVPKIETDSAVIVASTTSSDDHIELLQLQDALR
ncbi:MAG: ribose-phosphate pyrophosphokinase-like domain-containing protein, partial [Euryarchaeota archaeon]|nr:ribose-phosphate pyrophosphokinase-like domain-containing protein [Euryarchaeota archaeon]